VDGGSGDERESRGVDDSGASVALRLSALRAFPVALTNFIVGWTHRGVWREKDDESDWPPYLEQGRVGQPSTVSYDLLSAWPRTDIPHSERKRTQDLL
jgi:hypothetical protein